MEIINQYHEVAAVFIARVFLGFLFFFQGYDAVFRIGMPRVVETYKAGFLNKGIPGPIISLVSWYTTFTELICGLLLVVGLFEYLALYLLGINLIIAAIGFGMNSPLWDTRNVMPRLILLIFLLLIPSHFNQWSLDYLIFFKH